MSLTKVRPGQSLKISAEAFNAFIDAAQAQRGSSIGQAVDDPTANRTAGIVTVRNDSSANQERFAVLGIDVPLILPAENSAAFQERVALSLVAPDADLHRDRLCILQEPIASGALGRGLILGVSPVHLQVTSEDDRTATVTTGDSSVLTTGAEGSARILWKEPGTGLKWGLVQIPAGGGTGGSPNLVLEVTAANHPWFVGDVLRWNGAEWVFADAAVVGATDTLGVVGRIPDADTALLVLWGICCLENLAPHTDYWLDPVAPGALTAIKPSETPRLVLHHAENGLCILRAGDVGSGGAATRFADLSDVDVVSTPPTDQQAVLWDAAAERWVPGDVVLADPVPANTVLAGPESGADAKPEFRHLILEDLPELQPCSVVANATVSQLPPTALAALEDDRALLRVGGTLQWLQITTEIIADEAITTDKIAIGAVDTDAIADAAVTSGKLAAGAVTTIAVADAAITDAKIVSLSWGKLSGVPTAFPPTPHEHPLSGALTGTTGNAQIAPSAVGTTELADGSVTPAKFAPIVGPAVIGRAIAGNGVPAAIAAAVEGGVLRRSGGILAFARITDLEVAVGAAIAWSKINKAGAVAADIGAAPASHTHQLAGLGDVLITAPTVGQVLAYDAVNGRWINDDGGGGPGAMRPYSVWVNPTNANAEGIDLPAPATNRVLARGLGNLQWTQVSRAMLEPGFTYSVMGCVGEAGGPVTDLAATPNTVLRLTALGEFGFGKITTALIDSQQSDSGFVLTSGFGGQPAWNRNVSLGSGAGSSTSIQGSLIVVISNNGDYAKISSAGIELFRRSISTFVPLVKLDLNAYASWTTAKAMGIREIDVCDNGVPKKMLVLASAAY